MRVFCVSCGAAAAGEPGARVTCSACSTAFDIPLDVAANPAPPFVEPAAPAVAPRDLEPVVAPRREHPVPAPSAKVLVGQPTNGWAVASLVFSILCCIPFVSPIAGFVCGLVALNQLSSGPGQKGTRLAITGIVFSLGTAAITILVMADGKW